MTRRDLTGQDARCSARLRLTRTKPHEKKVGPVMVNDDDLHEKRVQRMAKRQGLEVVKTRPRSPLATSSRYGLADQFTGLWVFGVGSLTLDEMGEYLEQRLS